ncbi:uncharacterized protein LOC143367762 [Andrena cerasifolii]|uniref:uncharacterized protein LOC143367762 n=1 Tax=Andrena cerasifolii TaxID=2819439 RepID=UPI004037678B
MYVHETACHCTLVKVAAVFSTSLVALALSRCTRITGASDRMRDYIETMNGFRTLVFQDLPHVLPPKGIQVNLSSSHLHTTSSSRRFWNFFEVSGKEEICRESRKCAAAKDLVSSSLATHHELEDASRAMSSMPAIASMALAPKTHAYQFDLKATPMNCPRIQASSQEENLMSLLDGNPVPRTLKWKLTGYKTLRNEQAGDFAFVPGGETYDLDVLPRNDCGESVNAAKTARMDLKPPEQEKVSPTTAEYPNDPNSADTLSLSTKSIENKAEAQDTAMSQAVEVSVAESAKVEAEATKTEAPSTSKTGPTVDEAAAPSAQKLFTAPAMKNEGVKYLPISKSELPPSQMKCQAQPSVQYSSRPPSGISKPAQPVLQQRAENLTDTAKLTSSMEPQKQQPPQSYSSANPTETSAPEEATQATTSGWSPVEQETEGSIAQSSMSAEKKALEHATEKVAQAAQPGNVQLSSKNPQELQENVSNRAAQDASQATESKGRNPESYFAPRSWKQSDSSVSNQAPRFDNKSSHESLNQVYASFGWKNRESTLKISSPHEKKGTSPCAATQARLQGSPTAGGAPQSQEAGAFGHDGSSMSGSSGGGSRKPPSYPPFPPRRASSNSSSPLGRLPSVGARSRSRGLGAPRSGTSSIFTASMNPSSRRCKDGDEGASGGKTMCTKHRENKSSRDNNKCSRRRSCDRQPESRKCQKESKSKKACQRYCCPALQQSVECDYDLSYCPKDGKPKPKKPRDPTCLPTEKDPHYDEKPTSDNAGGRQICTDPSKRSNKCERRPRKCDRERRERSCNQEQDSCRKRERSCKRQERQSCSRGEESQSSSREICTKPRRRESCGRRRNDDRDCGNRPAKCTGRRHYTQSAFAGQTNPGRDVKRFSSLPLLTVSFIGVKLQGNKLGQNLADPASQDRSYGKQSKPSSCKPSACEKTSKKCKKPPAKCVDKKSSTSACKKPPAKCLNKKSSTTCGKSKPKKEGCGKTTSQSDEYCAKRKKQLGKDKSAARSEESSADRTAREKKEMLECKQGASKAKGKDKKEKKTGLERVVSPCKQRQMKKQGGTCGCSSSKCIGVPLNCLASADSLTFMRQESKPFNGFLDRSYSTVRSTSSGDFETEMLSSNQSGSFLNFAGDDILGSEVELPLPIAIDNQEEAAEDNSFRQNWILSWFNAANP